MNEIKLREYAKLIVKKSVRMCRKDRLSVCRLALDQVPLAKM